MRDVYANFSSIVRIAIELLVALHLISSSANSQERVGAVAPSRLPAELADLELQSALTLIGPATDQGGIGAPTTVVGRFQLRTGQVINPWKSRSSGQVVIDSTGRISRWRDWTEDAIGRVPSGVGGCTALDTRREQLWVQGPEDVYYRFSLKEKRWIERRPFPKGLACLVYDPDADRLLAVQTGESLLSLSPDGELDASLAIRGSIPSTKNGTMHATWVKGYVVLATPTHVSRDEAPQKGKLIVIDLKTGAVAYSAAYTLLRDDGAPLQWMPPPMITQSKDDASKLEAEFDSISTSLSKEARADVSDHHAELREHAAGDYGTVRDGKPEIHVVGIDTWDKKRDGNPIHMRVVVRYRGRPILLVLSSTHPTNWDMAIGDDVRIARLLVHGPQESRVEGVPASLKIERFPASWDSEILPPITGEEAAATFPNHIRMVLKSDPMTFQSFHREPAALPKEITIGPENEDWRLQHVDSIKRDLRNRLTMLKYSRQAIVAAMPREVIDLRPGDLGLPGTAERPAAVGSWWGMWNFHGPKTETTRPLAIRAALVADDGHRRRYLSDAVRVYRLDDKTGRTETLPWDGVGFRQPVVAGLCFGGKEPRLFAVLLDESRSSNFVHVREQRLYRWDERSRKWTHQAYLFAPLTGLAYDRARDAFYSLLAPSHKGELANLATFTRQGIRLGITRLTQRHPWHPRYGPSQLSMVGDRLVIITPPRELPGFDDGPPSSEMYIADPVSGQTTFVGSFRSKP